MQKYYKDLDRTWIRSGDTHINYGILQHKYIQGIRFFLLTIHLQFTQSDGCPQPLKLLNTILSLHLLLLLWLKCYEELALGSGELCVLGAGAPHAVFKSSSKRHKFIQTPFAHAQILYITPFFLFTSSFLPHFSSVKFYFIKPTNVKTFSDTTAFPGPIAVLTWIYLELGSQGHQDRQTGHEELRWGTRISDLLVLVVLVETVLHGRLASVAT